MEKAKLGKVQRDVLDTVLQEGIDFYVDVNSPGLLRRLGILPKSKHLIVNPIVMGSLIKISRILLEIEYVDKVKQDDLFDVSIDAMATHTERILDVIVLAIHNSKPAPKPGLKRFLRKNMTPIEMLQILALVIKQMQVSPFVSSIISIKGMSLIEKPEEKIASGASSEE